MNKYLAAFLSYTRHFAILHSGLSVIQIGILIENLLLIRNIVIGNFFDKIRGLSENINKNEYEQIFGGIFIIY